MPEATSAAADTSSNSAAIMKADPPSINNDVNAEATKPADDTEIGNVGDIRRSAHQKSIDGTDADLVRQRDTQAAEEQRPFKQTAAAGVGRIVLYRLSKRNADDVNGRREHRGAPVLGQAHVGNRVEEGMVLPMIVVRSWGSSPGSAVNGRVFLDGSDVLWVQSVVEGDGTGQWMWPQRD